MSIAEAQRDVRGVYAGGFFGQLISGVVWLASAAMATWVSPLAAVATLILGGVLIFPLTTLVIRVAGRPASLPRGHPMAALAMQVATAVPIGFVVVVVADGEGSAVLHVLGAPEAVLGVVADRTAAAAAAERVEAFARDGLRVVAVASRRLDGDRFEGDWATAPTAVMEECLELRGLIALEDPPRDDVDGAIAGCERAASVW